MVDSDMIGVKCRGVGRGGLQGDLGVLCLEQSGSVLAAGNKFFKRDRWPL